MYLTVKAVVLRYTDFDERDTLLTLLTQKHGKLTVKARGLRRKNNPVTAACQLYAYSEFTLFEYQGRYTVNEAHVLELFLHLRDDLLALALAGYFSQVAEVLSQEDYPTPELQSLLLNSLYALSEGKNAQSQIKAVFELRAACISGYTPDLACCSICGRQEPELFVISGGVLVCQACSLHSESNNGIVRVTSAVLAAMRYICSCEQKKILAFRLRLQDMHILSSVTEKYLLAQTEHEFSSLDYYKKIAIRISPD